MSGVAIEVRGLQKRYRKGNHPIEVLQGLDLSLAAGDAISIVGPSGCGKSTLLHLLGMLDTPSAGTIRLGDVDVTTLSDHQRAQMRNRRVGFVFQAHHLLPEHTALGNVMIPVRLAGGSVAVAKARAEALLKAVGLADRTTHQPGELSGGEQQRVALARALVMGPGLILADEPTGNLDPSTAQGVFELMLQLNDQLGSTLVVVTHSMTLAQRFPRRFSLTKGRLAEAEHP